MAIAPIFADSFDHYADAEKLQKWTQYHNAVNGDIAVGAYGRRSGSGLRIRTTASSNNAQSGRLRRVCFNPTPAGARCIVGWAFKSVTAFNGGGTNTTNDASAQCMCAIYTAGTINHWLRLNINGTISVLRGTTVLGTSGAALAVGTYHYVEMDVLIDNSVGTVDIFLDNINILTLTAQDTQNGATATWDEIIFGPTHNSAAAASIAQEWNIDDLYVLDGAAGDTASRLGDSRVDVRLPTAEGNTTQFTPLSGTDNALMVDESSVDGDTTYNESNTSGHKDTLVVQDAAVPGADIHFVQVCVQGRKTDAGAAGHKAVCRSGGADYLSSEHGLAATYMIKTSVYHKDPNGTIPWVDTAFNAAEFGYTKSA